LEIDDDGCVNIKWYEISEEDRNGVILGYKIYYRTACFSEDDPSSHSGHVEVMAPSTHYKLCNIPQGWQYRIGVSGFTQVGSGPSNEREIFTGKQSKTFCSLLFIFSFCIRKKKYPSPLKRGSWNSLRYHRFKRALKTYLFRESSFF